MLKDEVRALVAAALPERAELDMAASLRGHGFDSLSTFRLWLEILERFGVDLPLDWLGGQASVGDLAERIACETGTAGQPERPSEPGAATAQADGKQPMRCRLTPVQESYLVGRRPELTQDPVGCQQYVEFEVADLDPGRLRAAWQRLVERHAMLRATVGDDGWQTIGDEAAGWDLDLREIGERDDGAFEAEAARVRAAYSTRVYRPGQWPMFAIAVCHRRSGTSRAHLSIDGLVVDGWSLDLLLSEWKQLYLDPRAELPQQTMSLADALRRADGRRDRQAHSLDLDFWRRRVSEMPAQPPYEPRASGPRSRARTALTGSVAAGAWQAFLARADAWDVSPSSLLLMAFCDALAFAGLPAPVPIVLTTSARLRLPAAADTLVGPFTGTALVRLDPGGRTPAEAASAVHAQVWQALEHGRAGVVEAIRELRRTERERPMAPLPFVFTSTVGAIGGAGRDGAGRGSGFGGDIVHRASQTSGIDWDAQVWEQDGSLRVQFDVVLDRLPFGVPQTALAALLNGVEALGAAVLPSTDGLNPLQQAYYVARMSRAWPDGCQMYQSFTVPSADPRRLERVLVDLMRLSPALRCAVGLDGAITTLATAPDAWHVPVIDLAGHADPAVALAELARQMTERPFPLGRWPQFDVRITTSPDGSGAVHCAFDLAVLDAPSIHRLSREIVRRYADPAAADWTGLDWTVHWRARAASLPNGPDVAADDPDRPRRHSRLSGHLPDWGALVAAARSRGVSPDALMLAAFAESVAEGMARRPFGFTVVRWSDADDGRRPGEHTALTWLAGGDDGRDLDERAAAYEATLGADPVDAGGLAAIRTRAMREAGGFQLPVVYTSVIDADACPLPPETRPGPWLSATPQVSLDCVGLICQGRLEYHWDLVAEDFPGADLPAAFAGYGRRLEQLCASAGCASAGGRQGPPAGPERHRILVEWNDTAADYPRDRLIHQGFEERARAAPDATALRGQGWTCAYGELNRRANKIAWRLKGLGVGPGNVVGVRLRRGATMIAAVLGVLKAGAAYLPVEPGLPGARQRYMLGLAGAKFVLASADVPLADPDITVIDAEQAAASGPEADPEPAADPGDLAYVIFTSGSTGRPKGVAVQHRPVLNLLSWCSRKFAFDAEDVGLCVTSLGFDLSVFDIFGLLGAGAALYIADEEQQRDPALLLEVLTREGVTFWNSAPTTLAQLAGGLPGITPGSGRLRLVFLSGDYTPLSLPGEVRRAFPDARIVSLGGATEATVWSNYFVVDRVDPSWRSIPYGRPIDNARYYILDEAGEPCPVGVRGELYIGGECLSQGYINQPDLTAERFVPDPFVPQARTPLYRTGDLASYFPDGTICFLGRADTQVKIRGFRVEPAEIEHQLRRHPAVKDAVVLARGPRDGERKLVAYLLVRPGAEPTAHQIRAHVAEELPEYMVPSFVTCLEEFPATANGKLDRDALPWPLPAPGKRESQNMAAAPGSGSAAPGLGPADVDRVRAELARLFAEALELPDIDPDADLWDQGATSFTIMAVSNVLQRRYNSRIPVSAVLNEPTAASVARYLCGVEPPATATATTAPAVDFFSAEQRERFKAARLDLRPATAGQEVIRLGGASIAQEYHLRRASARSFTGPVSRASVQRLLGLLRVSSFDGVRRRLYPSAGDTYGVQVYLHVRENGVTGLAEGTYYYNPQDHALQSLRRPAGIDRTAHFYYNRPLFDTAAFEIFLFGRTGAVVPLYGEQGLRYLALEAGYLGQLLMTGQAACGIGLCPVGAVSLDQVAPALDLPPDNIFLQSFLGGAVDYPVPPVAPAAGELSAFIAPAEADRALSPATTGSPAPAAGDRPRPAPLAIIGLAGRYPGAADLDELWRLLAEGRQAIGAFPAARAEAARTDHGQPPDVPGGYLDDIESFDALLFGVSPREVATIDPQARLLLPVVWQCLENAGHSPASLNREAGRVGVFVGVMWQDHNQAGADMWRRCGTAEISASGSDIPNRLSHFFDFRGPSVAVDTSCASALTALHLAAESVRRGECGAAVVAAVNLVGHPYHIAALDGLGLLARDGSRLAFDASRSGWSPGEGAGAILLRPMADAGSDTVAAVVAATWVAHSGRTSQYGAPHAAALADSVRTLLDRAGLEAADIDYVECAAGGASVADSAEIEALAQVFASRPAALGALPIGTVKPNIGHLESAAGLSQLAKVVLQISHRELAPTLVADDLNPLADWSAGRLRPVRGREPYAGRATLLTAVGAAGSYAHAVVRAAEPGNWPARCWPAQGWPAQG